MNDEELLNLATEEMDDEEKTLTRGLFRGAAKKTALRAGSKFVPGVGEALIVADAVPVLIHGKKRSLDEARRAVGEVRQSARERRYGKALKEAVKGSTRVGVSEIRSAAETGVAALTSKDVAELMYSKREKSLLAEKRAARKAKSNRQAEHVSFEEYVEFRTGPRRYMVEMMADIIRMREKQLHRLVQSDHPMGWMAGYELRYREAKNNPAAWGTGKSLRMTQTSLEESIENLLTRFQALSLDQLATMTHEEKIDVITSLQALIRRKEVRATERRGEIIYERVRRAIANGFTDYESIIPF